MLAIRKATAEDVHGIFDLMKDLAKHHSQESLLLTNPNELLEAGFSNSSKFSVLLAEYDQQIAGYLSYTINYSIWQGADYANLDDLFVKGQFRSKYIGLSLMQEFKRICLDKQIRHAKWEVEVENIRAIEFYKKLGAGINHKGIFKWAFQK